MPPESTPDHDLAIELLIHDQWTAGIAARRRALARQRAAVEDVEIESTSSGIVGALPAGLSKVELIQRLDEFWRRSAEQDNRLDRRASPARITMFSAARRRKLMPRLAPLVPEVPVAP